MKYCIYVLYKDDDIHYIGMSKNIKQRVKQHRGTKDFDRFEVLEEFDDKNKCLLKERKLIKQFKPLLNIKFNNNRPIREPKIRIEPSKPVYVEPVSIKPVQATSFYRVLGNIDENGVVRVPWLHDLGHVGDIIEHYLSEGHEIKAIETHDTTIIRELARTYAHITGDSLDEFTLYGIKIIEKRRWKAVDMAVGEHDPLPYVDIN